MYKNIQPIYVLSKGKLGTERFNEFKIFRRNLLLLRNSEQMSGIELAIELSISKKRILDFETGRCNPNLHELTIICKYFNCTLDEIMYKKSKVIF